MAINPISNHGVYLKVKNLTQLEKFLCLCLSLSLCSDVANLARSGSLKAPKLGIKWPSHMMTAACFLVTKPTNYCIKFQVIVSAKVVKCTSLFAGVLRGCSRFGKHPISCLNLIKKNHNLAIISRQFC